MADHKHGIRAAKSRVAGERPVSTFVQQFARLSADATATATATASDGSDGRTRRPSPSPPPPANPQRFAAKLVATPSPVTLARLLYSLPQSQTQSQSQSQTQSQSQSQWQSQMQSQSQSQHPSEHTAASASAARALEQPSIREFLRRARLQQRQQRQQREREERQPSRATEDDDGGGTLRSRTSTSASTSASASASAFSSTSTSPSASASASAESSPSSPPPPLRTHTHTAAAPSQSQSLPDHECVAAAASCASPPQAESKGSEGRKGSEERKAVHVRVPLSRRRRSRALAFPTLRRVAAESEEQTAARLSAQMEGIRVRCQRALGAEGFARAYRFLRAYGSTEPGANASASDGVSEPDEAEAVLRAAVSPEHFHCLRDIQQLLHCEALVFGHTAL